MHPIWWWLTLPGLVVWASVLLAPWRAWSTRETLDADARSIDDPQLGDVTVLIPARNEAAVIGDTLAALDAQMTDATRTPLRVVLIDDQSDDGTAELARAHAGRVALTVLKGSALPDGWAGKLWALEQGKAQATTALTLLLDADIALAPGTLAALLRHKREHGLQFVSLMAWLRMEGFWEKLLLPAFVYFFKLLYPFRLANSRNRLIAAAAGGCVLVDRAVLTDIAAFGSLRGALIDDCTLARRVKDAGHRTWLGLTHSALSLRDGQDLGAIHHMVARSAFTQLRYSTLLLLAVTAIFALAFWTPLAALFAGGMAAALGGGALALQMISYVPMLRYYRLSPAWALLMPLIATLYIGMTWSSALRYWRGVRSKWKGRTYQTGHAQDSAS